MELRLYLNFIPPALHRLSSIFGVVLLISRYSRHSTFAKSKFHNDVEEAMPLSGIYLPPGL